VIFKFDVKKIFEHVVSIPFVVVLVKEKIRREIRRKSLYLGLGHEALPGAPDELRVVEDVVSGSGLKGLETNGLLGLRCLETLYIHVTELNQGSEGAMVRRPLEFGECGGECSGSRKISGILQQPKGASAKRSDRWDAGREFCAPGPIFKLVVVLSSCEYGLSYWGAGVLGLRVVKMFAGHLECWAAGKELFGSCRNQRIRT